MRIPLPQLPSTKSTQSSPQKMPPMTTKSTPENNANKLSAASAPFTTKLTINGGGPAKLPNVSQKIQSASSSRMLYNYEISQELSSKLEECLENKYGGRDQAHSAAVVIQRFYRHYKLRQRFQRVTGQQPNGTIGQAEQQGRPAQSSSKRTLANTVFASPTPIQNRRAPYQNSQPTRYQPATSLSSQLRAERQQHGRHINLNGDDQTGGNKNGISPTGSAYSMRSMQTNGQQMRGGGGQMAQRNPLMDTPATPRLCQRRIQIPSGSTVFSAYPAHQPVTHFHPELYRPPPAPISTNTTTAARMTTAGLGPTTILVVDGNDGREEAAAAEDEDEEDVAAGYHRSQSPALLGSSNGLHVVQLQSSPGAARFASSASGSTTMGGGGIGTRSQGQSPSSSPMRHPQPPPLAMTTMDNSHSHIVSVDHHNSKQHPQQQQRSVWVPRHFVTGSSPTMHQQQIQQRQMAAFQQQQQHSSSSLSSITSAATTQQQMNMMANGTYAMQHQQQYSHHHRQLQQQHQHTPVVSRSHSSAASYGYQTGSLPRMGHLPPGSQHQQMAMVMALPPNGDLAQNTVATESGAAAGGIAVMQLRQADAETEQRRRRLYRIALNFFNKKPDRGVQLLIRWGFVEDSSRALARLFKERKGLSKQMIGEYLGTLKSPFHAAVLEHFIAEIPMYDMEIDKALRQLLMHFRLPGEAQKIDHIIQAFASRYVACNPHRLSPQETPDTVYILAFAVIMLNTDLHTPSLKDSKRMKLEEFIKNLSRVEEGKNLDRQLLTGIYERVKEFEFRAGTDHVTQVLKVDQSILSKEKPKLVEPHRRLICYCRLHQILDANKRQSSSAHQREIFLFNDLMLVCKIIGGRRRSTTTASIGQYQLRYSSQLIGLQVEVFQNSVYENGMAISFADGQVLLFNAKNPDDRYRFIADIRESVAESTEMEQWRIQLEMERQQQQSQPTAMNHHHPSIGARLAEHSFMPPAPPQQQQKHRHIGANGGTIYQQQQHNTSIGSSTTSAGATTIRTTTDSVQRDSGLPDDMDCCHNSVGHSHSTASSSSPASSPSPAEFT